MDDKKIKTTTIDWDEIAKSGRKYRREMKLRERLYDFLIKILWKFPEAVDCSMSYETLGELYCNVPDSLKNCCLRVDKFYKIDHDDPQRKEIIEWLENEDAEA